MTASPSAGALLGLVTAGALLLVAARLRATRRPDLATRLEPLLRRRAAASVAALPAPDGPWATLTVLLRPTLDALTRLLHRDGGAAALAGRLARAGRSPDLDRHRLEQVVWAASGIAGGLALAILALLGGNEVPLPSVLVLMAVGIAVGLLLHDRALSRAIARRGRAIDEQLPTVAELLAFAVGAGESPSAALDRIARTVRGDLAVEVSRAVAELRTGIGLEPALRGLADRCGTASVARFVDGMLVATERGTPLADVLRAQAADARAASRRALLERAGRRDALMLVPVVFLVLPIVVVVALFPGVAGLSLAAP